MTGHCIDRKVLNSGSNYRKIYLYRFSSYYEAGLTVRRLPLTDCATLHRVQANCRMRLCVLGFRYTCFCTVVGTRCQLTNKATEALILHFSFLSRCYLAGRLFDINSLVAFITFGCWHRHLTFPYLRPSSRHRTDSRDCGTQEDRAFMTLAYLKNGSI